MANKGRLGRGLGALIPTASREESNLREIMISEIKANPNQPRKNFNEQAFNDLVLTIKEIGVIQPIVVRKRDEFYEIVAGERRWRAAKTAGLKTLPCVVKQASEDASMQMALIENLQRQNLNPIEEAVAYDQLLKNGITQELLAKKLGLSRPYITNTVRLLRLPEEVKKLLSKGKITSGHARTIASLKDEKKQVSLAKKVVSAGLTVRQTEKEANTLNRPVKTKAGTKPENNSKITEQLTEALELKVVIRGDKNKGVVSIYFENKKQFNDLVKKISNGRK
jgi:ParB family chromosome partitioning protein